MTIAFSFSSVPSLSFPFSTHLMRQLLEQLGVRILKAVTRAPQSVANLETVQRGVE